jgi:hypothetical protein
MEVHRISSDFFAFLAVFSLPMRVFLSWVPFRQRITHRVLGFWMP